MCPIINDWFSFSGGAQGVRKTDAPLRSTLKRAYEQALQESGGDHVAARKMFPSHIQCNRRFDDYDADKLAAKFTSELEGSGRLDLEAPELRHGGKPRDTQLITNSMPAASPNTEGYRVKRGR